MTIAGKAAMTWEQLLSTKRFLITASGQIQADERVYQRDEDMPGIRSAFHVDHDRVVFSSAFRRLGRKTQVHPLAQNDHTHNRLTHSVEVASVGRSLGNRVGASLLKKGSLPAAHAADIGAVVQVACLAHDIGNPPFGHTGEEALRDWFRRPEHAHWLMPLSREERCDITTYEGNAHSLRMLTSLEMHSGRGGMRLTSASIGALIKYPWTASAEVNGSREQHKFNIYQTELPYFEHVAADLGLIRVSGQPVWARHPLSYLMEAADDICYAILDLEDAVEIGILQFEVFEELLSRLPGKKYPDWGSYTTRQKCSTLRSNAINQCIKTVSAVFVENEQAMLAGTFYRPDCKDLISACPDEIKGTIADAKRHASKHIYQHRSKLVTELASYPCLGSLLDILVPSVHKRVMSGEAALSGRDKKVLLLLSDTAAINDSDTLYSAYMKILDLLGAMTDNAAATLARELSGVGIL